jgi:hypothetical protein
MLAAPSNRLPWRTQHFLEWAYLAGFLRISGVSYQFRHDELRKWLTPVHSWGSGLGVKVTAPAVR